MRRKKYLDIKALVEVGSEFMQPNTGAFSVGDHIVIQEKMDGTNTSIGYDAETGTLRSFSRNNELSPSLTNRGFYEYALSLDASKFAKYPNYVIFGEWGVKNGILYNSEYYDHWFVFDVFDLENERWLLQSDVKKIAEETGLQYVNVLYDGEFISWEHCKSFAGMSTLAKDKGEGCVVKNQTKLADDSCRYDKVLKIVIDDYKEIRRSNHKAKVEDPQKVQEREFARQIVETIVTKRRVEKMIYKLIDEGVLPEVISPSDMKTVARHIPRRIYDDCVKEHKDMVIAAGKFFSKESCSMAMKYAKELILGVR